MPYGAEPASDRAKSPVQLRYVRHNPPRFVQFDSNQSSATRIGRGLVMHLWYDSLSSKDLLEACVAFAMGFTFVIAFRWKKSAPR